MKITNYILISIMIALISAKAEELHVLQQELTDPQLIHDYRASDAEGALKLRDKLSAYVSELSEGTIYNLECDIVVGKVVTNQFLVPIPYLQEQEEGLLMLYRDMCTGRTVECIIHRYFESYAHISMKMVKVEAIGRELFSPVPEWNVGQPKLRKSIELSIDHKLVSVNRWDVYAVKEVGNQLFLCALKVVKKEKG